MGYPRANVSPAVLTGGTMDLDGASISCGSITSSGTISGVTLPRVTLLDLTGTPGTSYDIGTAGRARVTMQAGHSTIAITSSAFTANTSLFLNLIGLTIDSSFPQLVVDYTQVGSHILNIVSTGLAGADYKIDLLVVNN